MSKLSSAELMISQLEISLHAVNTQLRVYQQEQGGKQSGSFKHWLEQVLHTSNSTDFSLQSENSVGPDSTQTVREHLISLLKEWRQGHGNISDNEPTKDSLFNTFVTVSGQVIPNSEQKFLSRVTDLILDINQKVYSFM